MPKRPTPTPTPTHTPHTPKSTSGAASAEPLPDLDIDRLVMIVVGAHPKAELTDRPVAYALRARVEEWMKKHAARAGAGGADPASALRALVVTDVWYLNDASLRSCPTISIGGPGVNALSAYLGDKLPSAYVVDGVLMVQLDLELTDLMACCWGSRPDSTVAAVEAFWQRYAAEFLEAAVKRAG